MKKTISILLMLVMMLSLSVAAFADSSSVEYVGGDTKPFVFKPGSEYTYTDMFTNFKNMLPGDTRTQVVEVKNSLLGYYKLNLYFKAVPHSSGNMPVYPDQSSYDFTFASVGEMLDFLDCFDMTIKNGDSVIYNGTANIGGPDDWIFLGTFHRGHGTTLTVTLHASEERLTSEFADKIGEVDWVFKAEEVPIGPGDNPKTGDNSNIFLYAALCVVSAAAVTAVVVIGKKRKLEE